MNFHYRIIEAFYVLFKKISLFVLWWKAQYENVKPMMMKIYKLAWGWATSKSGDKNSFNPYPAAVILHQI